MPVTDDTLARTRSEIVYDEFTGPGVDPARWMLLERHLPGGEFQRCEEPDARIDAMDGFLCVTVDRFRTSHDTLQSVDNVKHLLLSTTEFTAPPGGTAVLELEQRARLISPPDPDHLLGVVVCNVVDLSSGNAFGFAVSGRGVYAVHDVFDADPMAAPTLFANMAERPFAVATHPGQRHGLRLTFDITAGAVTWTVDGVVIHRAEGVAIPDSMRIGLGLLTGVSIAQDGSRSLRGQGLHACWSAPRMTVIPAGRS